MTTKTKLLIVFFVGMATGIFIISQLAFKQGEAGKNKEKRQDTAVPLVYLPKVPADISFAGEKVPVERWEVYEAFDRELIYNFNAPGHITYLLKLKQRFFPMIEQKLEANNIPDDFKYLCVAEGNLQNLSSKVGASGFWQFMKDTAPGYNLEISATVDERYDVEKSTDAACKYLQQAYNKFGNWTAAAASYNCGMGRYSDLATFQQTNYYYDLQLPDETNKYLFRILSFKCLLGNADAMGFQVSKEEGYEPFKTRAISVSESIPNLAQWALNNGSTYKMLKILNPWLRDRMLVAKPGKTYIIKLPV